ncbi:hypothetical protein LSAT2_020911 [Lamellibrachia satsuma]|nr:hypothetical protein LSAT2_020911 [Lamellibrachia satsuma]
MSFIRVSKKGVRPCIISRGFLGRFLEMLQQKKSLKGGGFVRIPTNPHAYLTRRKNASRSATYPYFSFVLCLNPGAVIVASAVGVGRVRRKVEGVSTLTLVRASPEAETSNRYTLKREAYLGLRQDAWECESPRAGSRYFRGREYKTRLVDVWSPAQPSWRRVNGGGLTSTLTLVHEEAQYQQMWLQNIIG